MANPNKPPELTHIAEYRVPYPRDLRFNIFGETMKLLMHFEVLTDNTYTRKYSLETDHGGALSTVMIELTGDDLEYVMAMVIATHPQCERTQIK